MRDWLATLLFAAGLLQLSVLVASALVPVRLNWTTILRPLPRLVRQLYWTYGGYVVLGIVGGGLVCLFNSDELASGTRLARCVCGYLAVFWGVRLSLQAVFDVKEHLTTWWLRAGYHTLTLLFTTFVVIFTCAAVL